MCLNLTRIRLPLLKREGSLIFCCEVVVALRSIGSIVSGCRDVLITPHDPDGFFAPPKLLTSFE